MNALQRDLEKMTAWVERQGEKNRKEDRFRLGFHLMPPTGWLNDPNGLCVYQGEYHVFFQYAPFQAEGGVKMWGHFKGKDLIHWEYMGVALYPDQPYDVHGAYSGSALEEDGRLHLFYTGNVKMEGDYDYITAGRRHYTIYAVSEDGIHFGHKECLMDNEDYPADCTCHVRDPKIWKEKDTYYMVQGARRKDDQGETLVFTSENRKDWRLVNRITTEEPFGYMWECPDYMELDGQKLLLCCPQGVKQDGILYENIYQCGYFRLDGDIAGPCTLEDFEELDHGFDFYAPQSFLDMHGRRILIGWAGMPDASYGNATTEHGWQHCLSIPRVLRWEHGRLCQNPVREMEQLRDTVWHTEVLGQQCILAPALYECEIRNQQNADLELFLDQDLRLMYSRRDALLTLELCGQAACGRKSRHVKIMELENLRIFADTSCVEIFINDGERVMTTRFYPEEGERKLEISGNAKLSVWKLKPMEIIW